MSASRLRRGFFWSTLGKKIAGVSYPERDSKLFTASSLNISTLRFLVHIRYTANVW